MTPLQLRVYELVRDMIVEAGVAPTLQEIADQLHIPTRFMARGMVDALVQTGRLRRTPARTRNLALPDRPIDLTVVPSSVLQGELARRGTPFRRAVQHPPKVPTKPCGFSGCQERVTRGHLLCRDHWFVLPNGLRSELVEHERRGSHGGAYQDAWRRACDVLEGARG